MALRKNLKELQVLGRMHDTIREGLVYELLKRTRQSPVLLLGQRHQTRHQGMSLDDLLTKLS
jgi:hypothetical protein